MRLAAPFFVLLLVGMGAAMVCGQSVMRSKPAIPEQSRSPYQRGTDALKKGDVEAAISNYT
ncbi:MAG: hypothetical protein ABI878_10755, partial [Acidobacteriota bacterium]